MSVWAGQWKRHLWQWLKPDGAAIVVGDLLLRLKPTKPQVESRNQASYASPGGPRAALWWHVSAPGLSAGCGRSCALPRRKRRYQRPPGSGQSHPPCPAGGSAISPRAGGDRTGVDWSALAGSGRQAASSAGHRAAAKRCTGPGYARGRVWPSGHRSGNIAPANPATHSAGRCGSGHRRAPIILFTERRARGAPPPSGAPNELSPTNRIRRLIAQRMADSAHTPPPSPTTEADAAGRGPAKRLSYL